MKFKKKKHRIGREQPDKYRLASMLASRGLGIGSYTPPYTSETATPRQTTAKLLKDLQTATIAFDSEVGPLEPVIQARWALAMNSRLMLKGLVPKIAHTLSKLNGLRGEHL